MSLAPKSNWRPSASVEALRMRAEIIERIRSFFKSRGVLEVETPLLCATSVTDPFIESIPALLKVPGEKNFSTYYLQTSPEYAMKRLLCSGSGAIFQICKAFRQEEIGDHHQPEFTMLEWYRPGFDHHALMDEMDDLLQAVLLTEKALRLSYYDLFMQYLSINPHQASLSELQALALQHDVIVEGEINDRDTWLMLLMSHVIEPQIAKEQPLFLYDFPATQAALARIQDKEPRVASRFEVYFKGIELANGFHELEDAVLQRKRFEENNLKRKQLNLSEMAIDEKFLEALASGLPDCAGVALGLDRLIMICAKQSQLSQVVSFNFDI